MTKLYLRFWFFIVLLVVFGPPVDGAPKGKTKVKVGFFEFAGYHETDAQGRRSGYGYNFLQLVRRYSNLDFEYVGQDKGWSDMLQMLRDGEIDMVTSAHMNAERAKEFAFSITIGSNAIQLTCRADDDRYSPYGFSRFGNMKVGMVEGSSTNAKFENYAKDNGFGYKAVYFVKSADLTKALRDGSIDAIVTSSLHKNVDQKMLCEFGSEPFYAIMRKSDKSLLNTINHAISEMDLYEDDWRNKLFYSSFHIGDDSTLNFTDKEKAFIKAHSTDSHPLVVAVDNNWMPFCKRMGNDYVGILPDYWKEIVRMTGMKYEFYDNKSDIFETNELHEGKADIYLGYPYDEYDAEKNYFVTSPVFMKVGVSLLLRKDNTEIRTIGLCDNTPRLNSSYKLEAGQTTKSYRDSDEAAEALKSGEVDAVLVYTYDGERLQNHDIDKVLVYRIVPGMVLELAAIVSDGDSRELMGIVTKCINKLKGVPTESIVSNNVSYEASQITVDEWIKTHLIMSLVIIVAVLLLVAAVVLLYLRNMNNRKKRELIKQRMVEVQVLNHELEEHQAQLEEMTAEQEAQIEEVHALNQELEDTRNRQQEAINVIQHLAVIYNVLYYVDLQMGEFMEIGNLGFDHVNRAIGHKGDAKTAFNAFLNKIVVEKYRDEYAKFVQLDNVREQLKERNLISKPYVAVKTGWNLGVFIAGERGDDGYCKWVLWGSRDINEEKNAEFRIERQFNVIRAISRRYYIVYAVDLEKDHFVEVFAPPHVSAVLGKEGVASVTLANSWQSMVDQKDLHVMEEFHNLSKWNTYLKDRHMYSCEYRGLQNGWSRATIFVANRNKNGDVTNVVYTVGLIHEQKAVEQALQDANDSLKQLMQDQKIKLDEINALNKELNDAKNQKSEAYGMVRGLSLDYHTIMHVSKANMRMRLIRSTGISTVDNVINMAEETPLLDKIIPIYAEKYVVEEDRERFLREMNMQEILKQLQVQQLYTVNYQHCDDNGRVSYHQIAMANADTADGTPYFVLGFRDIDEIVETDRKHQEELTQAKEAAEAANRAKTSFLFNMSHDIRTPMNAIIGFTNLLRKHQEEPEKRKDYLNKIEGSSNVLLSIINNVLEMARIEKGTVEIDESAWSAEQFNDTLYSIFHEMMKQKGLEFTRKIDVEHNFVMCDPTKLREVFINILSNAYKYTNPGGKIHMLLEEVPSTREGYAFYRTTITDTGIGMSEDFLPHLFEEFSREKNTTDAKIEGTGLGMPIVKRLVELMDGTIEVQSQKGVGSTFVVTIPHKITERTNLVDHGGVMLDPKLFDGKRILLAEDNDLNAEIAVEILGEFGFKVERAEDGAVCVEMLEKADDNYYDLVLMDIQMPNMNGYEATRAIRAMANNSKATITILAMTANAFEEDKREALRSGMNGHLTKPINVTEMMKVLASTLK